LLTAFESRRSSKYAKWKQPANEDAIDKGATVELTTTSTWSSNGAEWNALISSYLPQLKQFATRHLPAQLYGRITPDDLVQEVVLSGLRQLPRLELRHEQAFLSYLLTSIRHRIVDEVRRTRRQPAFARDDGGNLSVDRGVSPLQRLITRESLRPYAKALACLAHRDRQLIVLRLVRGLSCLEVAARLGMPSAAAARMAVGRALRRLEKNLNQADSPSLSRASIHSDSHQLSAPGPGSRVRSQLPPRAGIVLSSQSRAINGVNAAVESFV
jgi:RNA polymerase sigma-70 factor (ECF subfamily)